MGLRRALRKIGRAIGGPITATVDAAKAIKKGKGAKGAAKAFGRAAKPGASAGELHSAHTEAAASATESVLGKDAGGRVRDLGRILKPRVMVPNPQSRFERTNQMIEAGVAGHWRRAGRSFAALGASKPLEEVESGVDRGQAVGDLFDGDATERLDPTLKKMLKRIFGASIDYEAILIKRGRPAGGDRPGAFVTPGLIYLGDATQQRLGPGGTVSTLMTSDGPIALPHPILVHELVHHWEYYNSEPHYITEAIAGYAVHGAAASYRWWNFTEANKDQRVSGAKSVKNQGNEWRHLPAEPKAEFIQHAYEFGAFDDMTFERRAVRLQIDSTMYSYSPADERSYARAFGAGNTIDWSHFLYEAIGFLNRGEV